MFTLRSAICALLGAILCLGSALGQTVTGTISGSVIDPGGLPVAGAQGVLTQTATGERRSFTTDAGGLFVIVAVPPGEYTLSVEAPGFKRIEKTNLVLTQAERLAVGTLRLEVGSVTESITVEARGASIEVESHERTQLLTGSQIDTMQTRGRNYLQLLRNLPGMVGDDRSFESDAFQLTLTPHVNGIENAANSVYVDGESGASARNPSYSYSQVAVDAIAEVKVSTANYRAEDGRNGGAIIKTVTKSGTRDFRGTAYYYFRNEALNANAYVNKMNGVPKGLYRFNTLGATLGGPIFVPGKFNTSKDKLFFFVSSDIGPTNYPRPLGQVTVPTALERAGDFSQTVDQNNKLVSILDPANNRMPFPGNVIPKSRIDLRGQQLLGVFPEPNFFNRAISGGNYNYNFMDIQRHDTYLNMVKVDYSPSEQLRFSGRTTFWRADDPSYTSGGANWDMLKANNTGRSLHTTLNTSYTISPTLVNELNLSYRAQYMQLLPEGDATARLSRSRLGIALPQFYPANNPYDFIPSLSFGGVPGAAKVTPPVNLTQKRAEPLMSVNESLTKIHGTHSLKFGILWEQIRYDDASTGNFAGALDFSRDTNNPLDANWAYANAILGNYRTYSETDIHPNYRFRGTNVEWYAQDTWKATRRLTLDYGMRFTWATPYYQGTGAGETRNFVPEKYDPGKSVVLFRPVLNDSRQRIAQDPLTGKQYPALYIGAIVPGSGDVLNGMVSSKDPDVPRGFIRNRGVHLGPRGGFAYDLRGDGKTAIRGGFGIAYSPRRNLDVALTTVNNMQNTFTLYYGDLRDFILEEGVVFPRDVTAFHPDAKTPTIMSYSLGVQRSLPGANVLDVAYVATLGRHLSSRQSGFNNLPFGTRFLPSSNDPTVNKPLPDNFLRPYLGYGTIRMLRTVNSNYHSLQAQLNRRFTKGLQYAVSYTYSKSMGYSDPYATYYDNHLNYSKQSFDRTHMVSILYSYDVPSLSKLWNTALTRFLFAGWQANGTGRLQSGKPMSVGYSLAYTRGDITGGGDYDRVFVVQKPTLSYWDRSLDRVFNTEAFAPPTQIGVFPGNAPIDVIRGPGIVNFDMSFFKTFRLFREGKSIQFRWENYNIFNHASWNAVDNTARFDAAGKQVNARFGKVTGALAPRIMQLALRITF